MRHIVFRADASNLMGSGHIMRCLTLAKVLAKNNIQITFLTRLYNSHLIDLIHAQGYQVIQLPSTLESIEPKNEKTWLGCSQAVDAQQSIDALHSVHPIDWLIVDHYAIDHHWHNLLRPHCKKIMVIDDLANREYDCDALLDQTLARHKNDYKTLIPDHCQLLLGKNYMLLREEFAELRSKAMQKRTEKIILKDKVNVLISMGGYDPDNVSEMAINALIALKSDTDTDINNLSATLVLSSQSTHLSSLLKLAKTLPWLKIELDSKNMSALMLQADIAIGASGSTAWERCCLGLPTLSIETANNQKLVNRTLTEYGAILNLGNVQQVDDILIKNQLQQLLSDPLAYQNLIKNSFTCCDGKGVHKLYLEVFNQEVSLFPATIDDVDLLFNWQSNTVIRKYFRNPKPVEYEEHCQWFNKALKDNCCHLYIIKKNDTAIGMIRLDEDQNNELEISILVSAEAQGQKVAATALSKITKMFSHQVINAFIHLQNLASHRLFIQANFTKISPEKYCLRPVMSEESNQ